jgi:hypothetical protein
MARLRQETENEFPGGADGTICESAPITPSMPISRTTLLPNSDASGA